MSVTWLNVTTSALSPSSTARACFDEPACDWLMVRSLPVSALYFGMNALLMSA